MQQNVTQSPMFTTGTMCCHTPSRGASGGKESEDSTCGAFLTGDRCIYLKEIVFEVEGIGRGPAGQEEDVN